MNLPQKEKHPKDCQCEQCLKQEQLEAEFECKKELDRQEAEAQYAAEQMAYADEEEYERGEWGN